MWLQGSRWLRRKSIVPTRDVIPSSSLQYHPRYGVPHKMSLSSRLNTVNQDNRFLSLQLILQKLSGYVGRRQYKMQCDLTRHTDTLRALGMDWYEMKQLRRDERQALFTSELALTHSERAVLLLALQAQCCGVLRRSSSRHSTVICMQRGRPEHGGRCGRHGHLAHVYFEGKAGANPALLRRRNDALAHGYLSTRLAEREGVRVEVRGEPDFAVVGRFRYDDSPRIWRAPEHANFVVTVMGYEFRVHPDDPRARGQIEQAAAEWELHAAVTQQLVWEMLEMYAVQRAPQPLHLAPGEMGAADVPQGYSSAFTSRVVVVMDKAKTDDYSDDAGVKPKEEDSRPSRTTHTEEMDRHTESDKGREVVVVTEQRMSRSDGSEQPWFRAPLSQRFENDIPVILPYAPSLVIRGTFRPVKQSCLEEDVTPQLLQPVMDISCFVHPKASFWWNEEDEERCVGQILDYAKRIPYALPFNLYLRIDNAKDLRLSGQMEEMQARMDAKRSWFDLRQFCAVHQPRAGDAEGENELER